MSNKLSEKKLDQFHASIGRFVLSWAEVELDLDLLVLVVCRLSLRSDIDPRHELSEKIKFLRSEGAANPRLIVYRSIIERVIEEICLLSDTRHDYVHGAAFKFAIERQILNVTMWRLLQPSKKARRSPVKVTASIVDKTADRLDVIGGKLLDLAEAINHDDRLN
jgi:hypothetical protein